MLMNKDGKPYLTAAGGQYVADYAFLKLELTRLTNNKFATRLIKSPMMPEMSVTFMVRKLLVYFSLTSKYIFGMITTSQNKTNIYLFILSV